MLLLAPVLSPPLCSTSLLTVVAPTTAPSLLMLVPLARLADAAANAAATADANSEVDADPSALLVVLV
jgi:hypothetical protein